VRKNDLLKLHRRPERSFVPPEEEVRQSVDVSSPPPPLERRVGSLRNRRGQAACLEQRLRDAISNDKLFVMAGVSHECPSLSGGSSKKIPFLQGPTNMSVWRGAGDERSRRGIGCQIGDQSGVRIGAPHHGLIKRRKTTDEKLIVIGLKDDADVTVGIRDIHPEWIGRIASPEDRSVPVSPEHPPRGLVCEVLLRLDLPGNRGMTAVCSHDETRAEDVFLARRCGGSDSDDAVSLSQKRSHPGLVEDPGARGHCRIL
jgi:hypothetical protein